MVKILSKAGDSLADVYDVEGSIAGIEQLETRELPIVHELGATVFSERLSGRIVRMTTVALLQSTSFDIVDADVPEGIYRVLGLTVFTGAPTRVANVQVAVRDPAAVQEIPIFVWDTVDDIDSSLRILDASVVVDRSALRPLTPVIAMPTLGFGVGQVRQVKDLVMRGATTAFGAGTVTIVAVIYLALTEVRGVSSRGLPIPGW